MMQRNRGARVSVPTSSFQPVHDVLHLDLDRLERGHTHRLRVQLVEGPLGEPARVPVIVVHGASPGPVFGVTAALHGNELNGIPTIHRLIRTLDPTHMCGSVVCVPVVNIPGFRQQVRQFHDGQDLNRIMPGKEDGNCAQVYAWRFMDRVVSSLDVLFDLHTASFGRVNSFYIRADMEDPVVARYARLIGAEIILHNAGSDGTLRGACAARGISAITVEVGNPQAFQDGYIESSRVGLRDVMEEMGIVAPDDEAATHQAIECTSSFWLYTDRGGLLDVLPKLRQRVRVGDPVAKLSDTWGHIKAEYSAPTDGIVIGRATNPVAHTGARILHLGVVRE